MAKATAYTPAFNAGEFSPRMEARVDFDKYPIAVSRGLNMIALPQGGLTFRPGLRFVAEIKSSASASVLYGLEPVAGRGYVAEFGNAYIRFYRSQARMSVVSTSSVITNGTFTTNIANWTDRSTGTASISHATNRMALNGSGDGYAWAEQSISISGADDEKEHVITFTLDGDPGGQATVQVGTTSTGFDLFKGNNMGMGHHAVAFTPGNGVTTVYFQVINKKDNTIYLDDVAFLSNVPLEITSPYATADVDSLRFSQSNDVFYIFHPDYPPYKLERRGDSSWSIVEVFFEDGPWLGINPEIDLAEANLIKNPSFEGGMSDWNDSVSSGGNLEFDGEQGVVFLRAIGNASVAELRQSVSTPDQYAKHVIHFQTVGQGVVTFSIGSTAGTDDIVTAVDYKAGWYSVEFTPGVTPFHITFDRDTQDETIIPGIGSVFCYVEHANLLEPSGTEGSITVAALGDFEPFASTDVGRSLRLEYPGREPGWGIITGFTNSQSVTVFLLRKLPFTTPTESWRLGAWSETTGYPTVGTFYQQRLWAARTANQPQTLWASNSQDFENMRPDTWEAGANTVHDDNALDYTLASKRTAAIQWLAGARRLIIGTANGQWAVSSRGAALTPSDFSAEPHTSVRGADFEPIEIDNVVIFPERDQQSLQDIGYDYEIDGYKTADLNILADHIAGTGIEQIIYQAKPYSLAWARKADGTLAVLTYKRQQNVIGWTPVEIAGSSAGDAVVESLAVIPGSDTSGGQTYTSADRDELWMIVRRTINGGTERYIEVMEGFFKGPNIADYDTRAAWLTAMLSAQADAFYVDSGLTYSGVSTTTLTGLSHLEGESVYVNGNGVTQGPFTVSGGSITITNAVTKAQVGLRPEWKIRGLKMPYGAQAGSGVGQPKNLAKMALVLLDSGAFQYGVEDTGERGADPTFFTYTPSHVAEMTALFTGEYPLDKPAGGWDSDPRLRMKGTGPLPFTLLGLVNKVDTKEQ